MRRWQILLAIEGAVIIALQLAELYVAVMGWRSADYAGGQAGDAASAARTACEKVHGDRWGPC